jgi:hypothetical protein
METTDLAIADLSGKPAAPASSAGSAARARRELADAIADADAAAKSARIAADISARASRAKDEAAAAAARLRQDLDRVRFDATKSHAEACARALRAGEDPPACPTLPAIDTAPHAAAAAHLDALSRAAGELAAERERAAQIAGDAAARVSAIIDQINFANEAAELYREIRTIHELGWQKLNKLRGLIMLDEARPGGPQLRSLQEDLLRDIDRRKSAIAKDPRLIEQHYWIKHQDDLAAEQRRLWEDYRRRLRSDPAAAFDATDHRQQ